MAVNNLDLYDVLVDLVPGTFFLFLLILLFQINNITTGQGFGLLLIGYVVGRIIHAVGSLPKLAWLRIRIEQRCLSEYVRDRKHGLSLRNRLRSQYNDDRELEYEESELESDIVDSTISRLTNRLIDGQENQNDNQSYFENDEIETHDEIKTQSDLENSDDILTMRYYGENYLFDKDTLYSRYEIMATFYRSLWIASFFGVIAYTAAFVNFLLLNYSDIRVLNINHPMLSEPVILLLVIGFLIILAYISIRQRIKFRFKKTRAFINDLHVHFNRE